MVGLLALAALSCTDPVLAAHERAQDEAVAKGTEGELKAMLARYAHLQAEHEGDARYRYLYGRAFAGRGTARAIAILREVIAGAPDFAPAHRTLAEIYGSAAFADPARAEVERARFLALCPGEKIAVRPAPLPPRRAMFEGRTEATPAEVETALHADEERLLRMRLFDWWSAEEKQRATAEMKAAYREGWTLTARYYQRIGEREKAAAIYADLERRARK